MGTQPLRRAADARAVVAAVEAATGVPLHVLGHDEEGLLKLLGATAGRPIEAALASSTSAAEARGGRGRPGARARSAGLPSAARALTRAHVAHDPPTPRRSPPSGRPPRGPGRRPAPRRRMIVAVGGTSSNLVKVIPPRCTIAP